MSKLTPAEQGFVDGIRSAIEADQLRVTSFSSPKK